MKRLFIIIGLMLCGLTSMYSNSDEDLTVEDLTFLSEKVYSDESESYEKYVGVCDSGKGYLILQYCFIDCAENKCVNLVLVFKESNLFVKKTSLDIEVKKITDYDVFLDWAGSIGEYVEIRNGDDGFQMITFAKGM